jgi:chromosome segregation ATPase
LCGEAEASKACHAMLWDMEALQANIRTKGQLLDLKAGRDVLAAQVKLVASDLPGYQQLATRLMESGRTLASTQPAHRHALTVRAGMLQPAVQSLQTKLGTSQALLAELASLKHVEDQRGELDSRLDAMHRELERHTDALHACSQELETPRAAALHERASDAVKEARAEMFLLTQARQQVSAAGSRLAQTATALPRAMVQQLLTSLEGKQRWKAVNDALTQTDRDVQRVGRLIGTAREIERVSRDDMAWLWVRLG